MSFPACLLLCLLGSLLSSSWAQEGAQNGTKPEARAQCRPGDLYYKRYCYLLYSNYYSWEDAEVTCQRNGGPKRHLASLLSASEGRIVSAYLSSSGGSDVWIGLQGTPANGHMVWEWSDGTPVSLPLWDGRRLNTTISSNNCVSMVNTRNTNSQKSVQRPCTDTLRFLCKYRASY